MHFSMACTKSGSRDGGMGEGHAPQIFADQLSLSQTEGADYAYQLLRAPSDFHTFLHP